MLTASIICLIASLDVHCGTVSEPEVFDSVKG